MFLHPLGDPKDCGFDLALRDIPFGLPPSGPSAGRHLRSFSHEPRLPGRYTLIRRRSHYRVRRTTALTRSLVEATTTPPGWRRGEMVGVYTVVRLRRHCDSHLHPARTCCRPTRRALTARSRGGLSGPPRRGPRGGVRCHSVAIRVRRVSARCTLEVKKAPFPGPLARADDGTRTHDLLHGKQTL